MFRSFLILLSFPAFISNASAQKTWTLSGTIRGDQSEVLTGASIFAGTELFAIADSNGRYSGTLDRLPAEISVRHLGYYPQRVSLAEKDFRSGKSALDFRLLNQSSLLDEVTISAKPIETIVEEDFTRDIFDFGFVGPNILMLMRENKKYYIRLIRDDGEVLSQLQLPGECRVLHRSCFGDFHVVNPSWAWEIAVSDAGIDTLPRYSTANFIKFVQPCVQQTGGRYYYVKAGLLNQEVRYIVFEKGQEPRVAFHIVDQKGMDNADGAIEEFVYGQPIIFRTPYWAKGISPTFEFEYLEPAEKRIDFRSTAGLLGMSGYDDDQIYRIAELESIRLDSVYAPMLKINDTLYLFDHVNSRIVRFGPKLERTDVFFMRYHWTGTWSKLLMQDYASNRVFARFFDRKGLILKEINPNTGKVLKTFELSKAPYLAEKFKLRNGQLYFLGQPDTNTPNKMLYKMNIFAGVVR